MSEFKTPEINEETGEIKFPPIYQDAKETFLHNYVMAMNEINEGNDLNKPFKLLLINKEDEEELDLPIASTKDPNYSHDLIREVDKNPSFKPDYAPNRRDIVYGNTTLYLLEEKDNNEGYITNFQYSFGLGGYTPEPGPDEPEPENPDIDYGVGTLDEYIRPTNRAMQSILQSISTHSNDKEAHRNTNPYYFLRQKNHYYEKEDFVWRSTYDEGYLVLEAQENGISDDSDVVGE